LFKDPGSLKLDRTYDVEDCKKVLILISLRYEEYQSENYNEKKLDIGWKNKKKNNRMELSISKYSS
jgi:hypothetical protein